MNTSSLFLRGITPVTALSLLLICCVISASAQVQQAWSTTYPKDAGTNDYLTAAALDEAGNVYLAGTSSAGNRTVLQTAKVSSLGQFQWVQQYDRTNSFGSAVAVVVNAAGDVIVSSWLGTSSIADDIFTLKYDAAGLLQWEARYNGPSNRMDRPAAMQLDSQGNVYVVGFTERSSSQRDMVTIKFAPNGDRLWAVPFQAPTSTYSEAHGLALDSTGNLYVAGFLRETQAVQTVVVKYDALGNELWRRLRSSSQGQVFALRVETNDAVTLAWSWQFYPYVHSRQVSFDANGNELQDVQQAGTRFSSITALGWDATGQLVASGYEATFNDTRSYLTAKYQTDGTLRWLARYASSSNNYDTATSQSMGAAGEVYVTGTSRGVTTLKYDSDGNRIWLTNFAAGGSPICVTDPVGAIYVASTVQNAHFNGNFVATKYTEIALSGLPQILVQPQPQTVVVGTNVSFNVMATGEPLSYQWLRRGIPIDNATNSTLLVTNVQGAATYSVEVRNDVGAIVSPEAELMVRYPPQVYGPEPRQQRADWDGAALFFLLDVSGDEPFSFQWLFNGTLLSDQTNAWLLLANVQPEQAGHYSILVSNPWGSATSQVAQLTVETQVRRAWTADYSTFGSNQIDTILSMVVDPVGNTYLATRVGFYWSPVRSLVIKLDSAGQWLWQAQYARTNALPTAMKVDATGNVFVTGQGGTVKYDPAGQELWRATNRGTALELDFAGNVLVTTATAVSNTNLNYLTTKLDSAGSRVWEASYDAGGGRSDEPSAIGVDAVGNVYVTGLSRPAPGYYGEVRTVKYDAAGHQQWVVRLDILTGAGPKLAVEPSGQVLLAGVDFASFSTGPISIAVSYDSQGQALWTNSLGAFSLTGFGADESGSFYVTGIQPDLSPYSIFTIKYAPNGHQVWRALDRDRRTRNFTAPRLAVGLGGQVFVALLLSDGVGSAIRTLGYDATGALKWETTTASSAPFGITSIALAIATDGDGAPYIGETGLLMGGSDLNQNLAVWKYVPQPKPGAPTITALSPQALVAGGRSVSLTVDADGNGPLIYQWNHHGLPISGATSATYTFTTAFPTTDSFQDDYSVSVSNAVGSILSPLVYVEVGRLPQASISPESQIRPRGADLNCFLGVIGYRPLSFQWLFNGVPIPGAVGVSFSISNVQASAAGEYQVVVTNALGATTSAVSRVAVRGDLAVQWQQPAYGCTLALDTDGHLYSIGGSVWKLAANGQLLWSNSVVGADSGLIDLNGNVFSFGPTNVAKLDSSGSLFWTQSPPFVPSRIAADMDGNVLLAGLVTNELGNQLTLHIAKLSAAGQLRWQTEYAGLYSEDVLTGIAADSAGNVIVAGSKVYVYLTLKYDSLGHLLWANTEQSIPFWSDIPALLAVDAADFIYVAGTTLSGSRDCYILKYDSQGHLQWRAHVDGADPNTPGAMVVDPAGHVHITCVGATAKFDNQGHLLWSVHHLTGFPEPELPPQALVLDPAGNAYVSPVAFENDPSSITRGTGKISPDGQVIWVDRSAYSCGLAVGSVGELFATGSPGLTKYIQPAIPPTVLSPLSWLPGGSFQVELSAEAGRFYQLETSPDLRAWQPEAIFVNPLGTLAVTDPGAMDMSPRFYRARKLP